MQVPENTQQIILKLTEAEEAIFVPFAQACDDETRGFRLGMERAKRILLDKLVSNRKPEQKEG